MLIRGGSSNTNFVALLCIFRCIHRIYVERAGKKLLCITAFLSTQRVGARGLDVGAGTVLATENKLIEFLTFVPFFFFLNKSPPGRVFCIKPGKIYSACSKFVIINPGGSSLHFRRINSVTAMSCSPCSGAISSVVNPVIITANGC